MQSIVFEFKRRWVTKLIVRLWNIRSRLNLLVGERKTQRLLAIRRGLRSLFVSGNKGTGATVTASCG